MSKPPPLAAELDDKTLADLKQLAEHFGCSPEHLVTTAVLRFVNEEGAVLPSEFDDIPPYISTDPLAVKLAAAERAAGEALAVYLQESIDQADRGELISQEEMEAWFASRGARDAAE